MRFRNDLLKDWKRKALTTLGLFALGGCVLTLPFLHWFTGLSYDLLFAIRPNVEASEALIVYMDDASRIRYGQPDQGPWDHDLHLQLMGQLTARHAKAVVFDLLFDTADTNDVVDLEFARLIQDYGRVVLAAECRYQGIAGEPSIKSEFVRAADPLADVPWGLAQFSIDPDQTIRCHYFDPRYPSLASKAAEVYGCAVEDPGCERWFNYYGPHGFLRNVSFQQVLEPGAIPDSMISNKIVFVGVAPLTTSNGSQSAELFRTPHTRWSGEYTPGVEMHAITALNLIRRDWFSRLPPILEWGVLLGLSAGLSFGLPLCSPRRTLLAGLAAAGFVAVAALSSAMLTRLWFPWAIVSLVQVPAALGWFRWSRSVPAPSLPQKELAPGDTPQVPDHELIRAIGQGSYGQVWLARTVMGTYRAVKVVLRAAFDRAAPFEREYQGIKNFEPISRTHEGFVDILQVGRHEAAGYFYCVMEVADDCEAGPAIDPATYVPKTLAKEIARRRQLPLDECLAIGLALSEALQRLHRDGLLHRDIKPSNVIFVAGQPKLADVGLVTEAKTAFTFVGTEGFIPPEGPGTPQADVYSLGKVLYEISMGKECDAYPELPTTLVDREGDPLWGLNRIILKACAEDRQNRYQTAQELNDALRALANQPSHI